MSLRNLPKVYVRNPSRYNADTEDPELRARVSEALLRRGKIEQLQELLDRVLSPENSPLYNEKRREYTLAILRETQGEISSEELSTRVLTKLKAEGAIPGTVNGEVKEKLQQMLLECVEFDEDGDGASGTNRAKETNETNGKSPTRNNAPSQSRGLKGSSKFLMSSSFSSSQT